MCTRAQARIFLERFVGPRIALHSLRQALGGSGDRARSRARGIGSPGTSLSRAATQEHWPRHGAPWGDSTRQHTSSSLGPRCFIWASTHAANR